MNEFKTFLIENPDLIIGELYFFKRAPILWGRMSEHSAFYPISYNKNFPIPKNKPLLLINFIKDPVTGNVFCQMLSGLNKCFIRPDDLKLCEFKNR
jgi:hypothetical protein